MDKLLIFLLLVAVVVVVIAISPMLSERSQADRLRAQAEYNRSEASRTLALGQYRLAGAEAFGMIVAYSLPLLIWVVPILIAGLIALWLYTRSKPKIVYRIVGAPSQVDAYLRFGVDAQNIAVIDVPGVYRDDTPVLLSSLPHYARTRGYLSDVD